MLEQLLRGALQSFTGNQAGSSSPLLEIASAMLSNNGSATFS